MSGIYIAILVAACGVGIYILPSPLDPEPYIFEDPPPKLDGPLKPNRILEKTVKMFGGRVIGPESFAGDINGNVYTGTADGKIWKITGNKAVVLNRTGIHHKDCGCYALEPVCGRVKGMKIDHHGDLIVVDSYKGLFKVLLPSGELEHILKDGVDGKPFVFLNSLDIDKDGIIYFSESSSKWSRRDAKLEVIETNKFGRVMAYDTVKKKSWTVADGLYMANGLALSSDESYLLVNEMNINRITRIFLKGPKAGTKQSFLDNVPGYPDNIKITPRGTFYVAMLVTRFTSTTGLKQYTRPFLDIIAPYPALKRFIAKITPMFAYDAFLPAHSYFIEIDDNGNIINSFHDELGLVINGGMSEAFEFQGNIYLGHYEKPFVGVLGVKHL